MELTGKILIVDDEQMTLDFFDIMLSKLGFEIIKAVNGVEALEQVKLYNPDLILLDIVLPKMTGFEVTKALKGDEEYADFCNIPIIMFSALNDPKDKVKGLELGVYDYITKPFNFSEVLARIRSIFRQMHLSDMLLKRERRLAILESLNTNLIAFTRHVKKPLTTLYNQIENINTGDTKSIEGFIETFKHDYHEVLASLEGIEDEILDIEKKGSQLKEEELSLEELEKRITKHISEYNESMK
jgi:DNA-binding response OmpR family regulator